jgi:transposase
MEFPQVAVDIYKDREWLYNMYVKKRMNLKDIVLILDKQYNVKISTQGLYNWLEKYDLLKYRGKGKKRNANLQKPKNPVGITKSPARLRQERVRKAAKARRSPGPRGG